jgi:GT2 family glycosyltransferase
MRANTSTVPVVSVCIANYNGIGLIDDCITSVLTQDFQFPVEIIVHDDSSSDGSSQYIQSKYPDVFLIQSIENVGFCVANNRMAAAARGEYLLLLNNDAALCHDALSALHDLSKIKGDAILGLQQFDFDSGELIDRGYLLDPFFNPVPNMNPLRENVAMVIGACMWIPVQIWKDLGGFPEWFGSIAEDLYLSCYARLSGYSVMVLNTSGFRHRVGRSLGGGKVTAEKRLVTTLRRRALSERNKTFVLVMATPLPLLLALFPLHILILAIEGVLLMIIKRDYRLWRDVYLGCFVSVVRQFKVLMQVRQQVQGRRKIGIFRWLSYFSAKPYKFQMLVRYGVPEVRR